MRASHERPQFLIFNSRKKLDSRRIGGVEALVNWTVEYTITHAAADSETLAWRDHEGAVVDHELAEPINVGRVGASYQKEEWLVHEYLPSLGIILDDGRRSSNAVWDDNDVL